MELSSEAAARGVDASLELSDGGDPIVIGTSDRATFRVRDDLVAERHCRLIVRRGSPVVENLDEEMGTVVDGAFVEKPHALSDSHVIELAAVSISVSVTLLGDELQQLSPDIPAESPSDEPPQAHASSVETADAEVTTPEDVELVLQWPENDPSTREPEPALAPPPTGEPDLAMHPSETTDAAGGLEDCPDSDDDLEPQVGSLSEVFAEAARLARGEESADDTDESSDEPATDEPLSPTPDVDGTSLATTPDDMTDPIPSSVESKPDPIDTVAASEPARDSDPEPALAASTEPAQPPPPPPTATRLERVAPPTPTDASVPAILDALVMEFGEAILGKDPGDAAAVCAGLIRHARSLGFDSPAELAGYVRCCALVGEDLVSSRINTGDLVFTLNHTAQPAERRVRRATKIAETLAEDNGGPAGLPTAVEGVDASEIGEDEIAPASTTNASPVPTTTTAETPDAIPAQEVGAPTSSPMAAIAETTAAPIETAPVDKPVGRTAGETLLIPGFELLEAIDLEKPLARYRARRLSDGADATVSVFGIADADARKRLAHTASTLKRMSGRGIEPVLGEGVFEQGVFIATARDESPDAATLVNAALDEDDGAWAKGVREILDLRSPHVPPGIRAATEDEQHGRFRAAAIWVADVAEGVHALHEAGVYHGAIGPTALRVCTSAVRLGADTLLTHSQSDQVRRADPPRLAPEWLGALAGDAPLNMSQLRQADVWALGSLLLEFLTGKPPYVGEGPSLWRQLATVEAASPSSRLATTPVELNTICRSTLARDPRVRPRSAAVLASMLRSAVGLS